MEEYNLLEHLGEVMDDGGKKWKDVLWVGNYFGYVDKEKFLEFAKNFNYYVTPQKFYQGYKAGVCKDLVVVGEDWWVEWDEEYGVFEYLYKPRKPSEKIDNIAKVVNADYKEGTYFQGELDFGK